jgi:hypothetical protein
MDSHDSWSTSLRCPECRIGALVLRPDSAQIGCARCGSIFPVVSNRPVLLRRDNELFARDDYSHAVFARKDSPRWRSLLGSLLPTISVNLSRRQVIEQLVQILDARGPVNLLVVGGGRQRSQLDRVFQAHVSRRVCYVDIDAGAAVPVIRNTSKRDLGGEARSSRLSLYTVESPRYVNRDRLPRG